LVEVALFVAGADSVEFLVQDGLVGGAPAGGVYFGLGAVAAGGFLLVVALGFAEVVEEAGELGLEAELVVVDARERGQGGGLEVEGDRFGGGGGSVVVVVIEGRVLELVFDFGEVVELPDDVGEFLNQGRLGGGDGVVFVLQFVEELGEVAVGQRVGGLLGG
jgi:hypothetical protein